MVSHLRHYAKPALTLLHDCKTSQRFVSSTITKQSVLVVPGLVESVGRPAADEAEDLHQGHPEVGPPPGGPPLHLLGRGSEIRGSVMGYNGESWRGRGPNFDNHLMCVK